MRWSDRLAATSLAVAALVGLAGTPAAAHDGNVGYSEISLDGGQLGYDLYLDRRFLATALPGLRIDDATVDAAAASKLLAEGVAVTTAGRPVAAGEVRVGHSSTGKLTHLGGVSLLSDVPLLHIHARYELGGVDDYTMEYRLFLPDKGQQPHSNLAWIHQGGQTRTFIFAPGAATLTPGAGELVASTEDAGSAFPVALAVAAVGVAVLIGAGVLGLRWGRRRVGGGGTARTTGQRRRASAVSGR